MKIENEYTSVNIKDRSEYLDAVKTAEILSQKGIQDVEWVVVDNYNLNHIWQSTLNHQSKEAKE